MFRKIDPCVMRKIIYKNDIILMTIDEDINTSVTIIPSVEILGPITRSQAQ
jgi:hypothetical protein